MDAVATASIPWQIIVAVIVFNIVAGMISKRKQKPPAKPDPKAEAKKAEAQKRMEEARAAREKAAAERKTAEREARRARDGEGENGESEEAEAPESAPAKPREIGKSLLETLAKELGLELPVPQQPAPRPPAPAGRQPGEAPPSPTGRPTAPARPERTARPAPPPRQPTRAAQRPAWKSAEAEDEHGEHSGTLADLNARTRSGPRDGEGDERPAYSSPLSEPTRPIASASSVAAGLDDPEALRKAFILKTLLDKPLALEARRGRRPY